MGDSRHRATDDILTMSIALEAKVTALERKCAGLDGEVNALRDALHYFREQFEARLAELERTAQRKPGPKPKDSNG